MVKRKEGRKEIKMKTKSTQDVKSINSEEGVTETKKKKYFKVLSAYKEINQECKLIQDEKDSSVFRYHDRNGFVGIICMSDIGNFIKKTQEERKKKKGGAQ